ncbi:MAG: phosphatidate cytidylyltransferase [Candidatus Aerophobetes bacterium]|nr:phosphatidate cytidylyltransferase [Candidatus Aerophobetes bacterium]
MLLKRIIIAVIFIPLLILLIFWGGIGFLLFVCLIISFALFEFYREMEKGSGHPFLIDGIICGVLVPLFLYIWGEQTLFPLLTLIVFYIFFRQFFKLKVKDAFANISLTVGGIFYISFLFSYILLLRSLSLIGAKLVITVFFVTWMSDSGAYLIGRAYGRHKFLVLISPRKSIEGFGGAILVAVVAIFISRIWLALPLVHTLVLGICMGIMAQMGDFFESMLKREVGIKDFGRILPGHGGVLDRFDSLLFTIPLFYYYVRLIIFS